MQRIKIKDAQIFNKHEPTWFFSLIRLILSQTRPPPDRLVADWLTRSLTVSGEEA